MSRVLMVDIGGVIMSHTKVGDFYPPLPDVFSVLARLKNELFGENIFLVSSGDIAFRIQIYEWLKNYSFPHATGIPLPNTHFGYKRSEKTRICLELKVTHAIDDRRETLMHLHQAGIKNLYHFQGREDEDGKFLSVVPFIKHVASWQEVAKELLGS